jgi:hypothetical protein
MRYEFIVRDTVPEDAAAELPEPSSTSCPTGGTALFGPVRDESDVLTLVARLRDLGLTVVRMRPLPD